VNITRAESIDAKADFGKVGGMTTDTSHQPVRGAVPRRHAAEGLKSHLALLLETLGWPDFALLDSGNGRKLERYGAITVVRPEEQALWTPRLSEASWEAADAVFTGDVEEEGTGRWKFPKPLPETWQMAFGAVKFVCRFTSFRHVGVFPEQVAHWTWMADRIAAARDEGRTPRLLNLFGYTGLASLIAAEAGAEVTHVDASKKAIAWARENQALSGMEALPIRWICEDAMKFVQREVRRGKTYDAIILDPPKYGRGTNGEVWQLFEHLPEMLTLCRELTAPDPLFAILTVYAMRASFVSFHELFAEVYARRGGKLESGELLIREAGETGRKLATSLFCRWQPGDAA
jgi:23S rRNA (cytosine1962-C5)-methyltransferase